MNWALMILYLVFFGAGVPLLLGAITSACRTFQFSQWARHAEGVIVEAERGKWRREVLERHRARGQKIYELRDKSFPVKVSERIWTLTIEFEDEAGDKQLVTTNAGSRKSPLEIGQSVPILYDPDQPSVIRINSFREKWGGAIMIGVLGTGFVTVGLLLASGVITLK